ncbi:hypothetical protein SSCG_05710 [Streptomyces clavuligerus]|nr:hypothetical protein SSCG_05710 [Streptomyces clavuligerus]
MLRAPPAPARKVQPEARTQGKRPQGPLSLAAGDRRPVEGPFFIC